jgi:hypothetical protein
MNQNTFCSKCHRTPNQCCCNTAPRELSDEEIEHMTKKWFDCHPEEKLTTRFPIPLYSVVNLCKAILKKASEK